jgi:hypothetical protein
MERKLTEGWQLTGSDQEVLAAKGALGLAIAD